MRAKIGEVKLQNNLLSLIGNWSKRKDIRALEILHGEKNRACKISSANVKCTNECPFFIYHQVLKSIQDTLAIKYYIPYINNYRLLP